MDEKRKKELIWEYKNKKPNMGIVSVYCIPEKKRFLEAAKDIKTTINSNSFQLSLGGHPNKELQKLWQKHGEKNFEINVFRVLEYDEKKESEDYIAKLDELLKKCLLEEESIFLLKPQKKDSSRKALFD